MLRRLLSLVLMVAILVAGLSTVAVAETGTEENFSGYSGLPLTDEPVTLKLWLIANDSVSQLVEKYEDLPFFKELEKRTGVHIEIELVSMSSAASSFSLMISSDELPDLIMQSDAYGVTYADGLDAAVEDGYFLDITPYLDNLASDYDKARKWDIETELQTVTDSGRVASFRVCFTEGYQPPWDGMLIRKDWLDELNLEIPITYDDWHNVLTQFKEKKGATAALQIGPTGTMVEGSLMNAGYGVSNTFINVDRTVKYSPIEEGYREYLEMMHQWYKEGLVNPDFLSSTVAYTPDQSLIASGMSGAWCDIYTLLEAREALVEGMELVPVPSPVKNVGDTIYVGLNICGTGAGNYTVISADTKYPELCVKWCNYLYTQDCFLLSQYGIEGETYTMVDGKPTYTELVTNNEKLSFNDARNYYTLYTCIGYRYDWARETQTLSDRVMNCMDVWSSNYVKDRTKAYLLPSGVSMNAEENSRFATIMADISTYVTESTTQFITGEKPLSEWDNYVATIKGLKIDEAIGYQQAALDRYYAK